MCVTFLFEGARWRAQRRYADYVVSVPIPDEEMTELTSQDPNTDIWRYDAGDLILNKYEVWRIATTF